MFVEFLPERAYFEKAAFQKYSMSLPEADITTSINLMGAKID